MTHKGVAVVVGAGDGLGSAVAHRFARGGYVACLVRRHGDKLEGALKEIEAAGGVAHGLGVDGRRDDEMVALFERIERDLGTIEVVVHNIGADVNYSILEMDARKYTKVWEMACFSGFLVGREAARRMAPRGRGTILFTGATASLRGGTGFAAFAGAKFALRALAQSLARELCPKGIHVAHVVIDGPIDMPWIRDNFPDMVKARLPTDCWRPMRSPRATGRCTPRRAARGRRSSTSARGPRSSELGSPSREGDPMNEPVAPHTPLLEYYDEAKDPVRVKFVRELFDKTAQHYNTVEALFLNGGLWYRRFSMQRAGMKPGMKVLDMATGTGAVARGAAKIVGPTGRVFGCDPSRGMLREARKVFQGPLTRGIAEQLPFRSELFDFVTMGIALRHVADLVAAFREYRRMLKPGGKLWLLEGHVPKSKLGHSLTRFMWKRVIPGMTYVATRSRDAKVLMDYYWDTVEKCVPPETILAALREAGFADPKFEIVVPGAFCEYTAVR